MDRLSGRTQFQRHKILVRHFKGCFDPILAGRQVTGFRIILGVPQNDGIVKAQFLCNAVTLRNQRPADSLTLIGRQNRQRRQRKLGTAIHSDLCK